MALNILEPQKALNKLYRKQKPLRAEFDNFKLQLITLLHSINEKESEEYNKNLVRDFLLNTFYSEFNVNTKGKTDLAVYLGKTKKVGIIIETKKPSNNFEMVRKDDINKKAMHEAVLYYLRERIEGKNDEIKNIIITNNFQWFIFDAQLFEKLFYKNTQLKANYESWKTNQKVSSNTNHFYNEIAKPFLDNLQDDISFTFFDLYDYQNKLDDDKKLIPLFKVFSRAHLLKESFANDSNSLDKQFYNELLHIIGLEETKDGSKKVISRKEESKRESGSLLENTINILKTEDSLSYISNRENFGETTEEQIYSLALELNITWINRILFLKLLEGQLLTYHKGNKDYKFLDATKLTEYDHLYELFHKVLALSIDERDEEIKSKYQFVPYLNSSLFEISKLERDSIRISQLQDHAGLSILAQTKLKDNLNKKRSGTLSSLTYLLQFLDAYDFATESTGNDIQEEGKTLISASVLGLIFEKINGYKEGSFFTPGFITMYMARETIRRAVVQKFNDTLNVNYKDFEELKTEIDISKDGREKANSIINSLKICDPAVGSGHFLVSALNEIIVVKSELGVLTYCDGSRLQNYNITIENDELIITDSETEEFFEYHLNNKNNVIPHLQKLQETIFHEKQTIIENSLFGVDINPNSVNICRLRLWIELLKNAYYSDSNGYKELQTLPNIDINIKQGNSLVSRFDVTETKFTRGDKRTLEDYKQYVTAYKNVNDRIARKELKDSIDKIRNKFIGFASDPLRKEKEKLTKLASDLHNLNSELFGADNEKTKEKQLKLEHEIEKLSVSIKQKENEYAKLFKDAFEWRFEFPEVLDDEGEFIGFDVVIGNPPYIRGDEITNMKNYFKNSYLVFNGTGDIYTYFYERAVQISKEFAKISFITSNKFIRSNYGVELRLFLSKLYIHNIIDFGELPVFEDASTFPMIFMFSNSIDDNINVLPILYSEIDNLNFESLNIEVIENRQSFKQFNSDSSNWNLLNDNQNLIFQKMYKNSISLDEYTKGQIKFGIKTGFNEAFIINQSERDYFVQLYPKSKEVIKPFLNGNDVRKYSSNFAGKYLITAKIGIEIEQFPEIYNHLIRFKENLVNRSDKGKKWYELRSCSYYDIFEKPKILYPDIALEPRFTLDYENYYPNATLFVIPLEDKFLLGVLNSKLIWFYLSKKCPVIGSEKKRGRLRLKTVYISKLPIVRVMIKDKTVIENLVDQILTAKKANPNADTTALEHEIDKLVYELYNLTPEEIKIIEAS